MEDKLSAKFSGLVLEQILSAPFVAGVEALLKNKSDNLLFFIASATPEDELVDIVRKRELYDYFKEVNGTPRTKTEISKSILKNYDLSQDSVVFIGDAESDRNAANNVGIPFIARLTSENNSLWNCPNKIRDFTELDECLLNMKLG